MNSNLYILLAIVIMAAITITLRFLPFAVFKNKTPGVIIYLGKVLPPAIMAMLVVYCLKNISLLQGNHGIPEIISVAAVVILHKWKHNTLLSILCGTILYMVLIRLI